MYPRAVPRPEELRFRAGEVTLAGELLLPDAAPPGPARRYPNVLLLGSWLARDRDGRLDAGRHPAWFAPRARGQDGVPLLARVAAALAELGVASLRFDKRGCGSSGGSWQESDLFTLIDDARDALAALRGRRDLDPARTGIVGHGEGAGIAMSVAIGDPVVGPLGLIGASARSYRDVFRRGVAERSAAARRPAALARPRIADPLVAAIDAWSEEIVERADRREPAMDLRLPGAPPLRLALAGWEQAFHTPPRALATMLNRPVTLVHGRYDDISHPDESALLAAVLATDREPLPVRLPPAGHDLTEADRSTIDDFAAEIASRLVPRSLPPVLLAISEMG